MRRRASAVTTGSDIESTLVLHHTERAAIARIEQKMTSRRIAPLRSTSIERLKDRRGGDEEEHGEHSHATVHQFRLVSEHFVQLSAGVRVHGGTVDVVRDVARRVHLLHDARRADGGDDEDDAIFAAPLKVDDSVVAVTRNGVVASVQVPN